MGYFVEANSEQDKIKNLLSTYTVALGSSASPEDLIGSGTLIKSKHLYGVLTAAHI